MNWDTVGCEQSWIVETGKAGKTKDALEEARTEKDERIPLTKRVDKF